MPLIPSILNFAKSEHPIVNIAENINHVCPKKTQKSSFIVFYSTKHFNGTDYNVCIQTHL